MKADDGSRTRDLRLGKPTLYQLSYVRVVANQLHAELRHAWNAPRRILPARPTASHGLLCNERPDRPNHLRCFGYIGRSITSLL
jgi:hypothetical protein